MTNNEFTGKFKKLKILFTKITAYKVCLKSIETLFAVQIVNALEKKVFFCKKMQAFTSVKMQFHLSITIT